MPEIPLPDPKEIDSEKSLLNEQLGEDSPMSPKDYLMMATFRFIRGFLTGFFPSFIYIIQNNSFEYSLFTACVLSGVSAGLLALDKLFRELNLYLNG